MMRITVFIVGAAVLFLVSCAHSLPEVRCDDTVTVQGPAEAGPVIAKACQRYTDSTEASLIETRRALVGTRVFFSQNGLPPECGGAPGCVRITETVAYIYVKKTGWRAYLPHEIHHILLLRLEPELPPHQHHQRMEELDL